MPFILEGVCTTRNADQTTNIAPMGPIVHGDMESLVFRPFQTSTTYRNLKRTGCGIFHITDDVDLIARAALSRLDIALELIPAKMVDGMSLANACRSYEFRVTSIDDEHERTEIKAEVIHMLRQRDFIGFNRAKHAILEATILATRLHLIPRDEIEPQLNQLATIVKKTATETDQKTFDFVTEFMAEYWNAP